MFSPTTIASSTTIPRTKMKVNKDIILIDTSNKGSNQNPPMKDIGMPSETQAANFGFKNKARTIRTSPRPR